jgi:2'-5' RNA ligase
MLRRTAHLSALAHATDDARAAAGVMRPASLHLTLAFVGVVTPGQVPRLEEIAGDGRAEAPST